MGCQDDCGSLFDFPDNGPQLTPSQHIQPQRGLIQKENLRFGNQRHGDAEPSLHAAR
ncbi:hypothetical protein SDC9_169017 [bioreactor metagenome]|uniref:Uncharacterized protein n=1 Tax=bioreactor metagenome TaxID=1076179 RepID=A0A645G406_9ZZZZ